MMMPNEIYLGDCTGRLQDLDGESIDLIYMDPPFFTQRKHSLTTRDESKKYQFNDSWNSLKEYLDLIRNSLDECKRVLKDSGSIFLHCDKAASHHIRVLLDEVFGVKNFRSEIIWSYKRWSNSKKGLLNSHQTIYFYSRSNRFKFNTIYKNYSASTNIDQILQERERSSSGKSKYKKDKNGNVILGKEKKGVPLSDVWEIPYLNPKAKERVGYPTQKPVLLLKQIIEIASDKGDLVLDPFCGSGTTCVAAKLLNRRFIGIDISDDAVKLAHRRLEEMVVTDSALLQKGRKEYLTKSEEQLAILKSIDAIPVQRNSGIDGFLKEHYNGKPVPVKIQGEDESLSDAINKIKKSSRKTGNGLKIVIQTKPISNLDQVKVRYPNVEIIKSLYLESRELKERLNSYPLNFGKAANST